MKKLLALLYGWGVAADRALTSPHRLPCPVISIGNIAVGGRAKTPFVIWLCHWLKSHGKRPVVLTRGYGRRSRNPVWMRPGEALFSAALCGDEPLEIFASTDVDVLVGSDRRQNALRYLERSADLADNTIFVLDDGFQHWKLARDFDLVLIEKADLEDRLLPAGRLRESPAALERAQCVFTRGVDFEKTSKLVAPLPESAQAAAVCTRAPDPSYREAIARLAPGAPVIELSDHAPAEALRAAMTRPGVTHWLLGAKEAAKLLDASQFRRFLTEGHAPGNLHYVACHLDIRAPELESHLEKWLRDLAAC